MVDKKTIGISALITLGLILTSVITPTFFDTPKFYCEVEASILKCPGGLSGGSGTRCYLNKEKSNWDYCSTGWMEITDDLVIREEPTSALTTSPSIGGTKWRCSPESCILIS